MTSYTFTPSQDWFSGNIPSWEVLLPLVKSSKPRALEIGSWEGRSAVFTMERLCKANGELVCIDHFDLFQTEAGRERYRVLTRNLELAGGSSRIIPAFSVQGIYQLLCEEASSPNPGFDWIYVDGSHEADDTFLDGELVWRLARPGAIMIFDDYRWNQEPEDSHHHPKLGIDLFLQLHRGQFERLSSDTQYQMVIRKSTEQRIGFLPTTTSQLTERQGSVKIEYGIHIAFVSDSSYALPTAVAIHTLLQHTHSRITLHIVDCGLTQLDRERIQQTVSSAKTADATIVFRDLPESSLAGAMGNVWGKFDVISILPVERVLYLDADILVRSSLAALWETDLKGHTIGAVQDIGHPTGHKEIASRPYFNAGVLLIDLAKARLQQPALIATARSMQESPFKDQDALNEHFQSDWLPLSLKWNAQGLGTYVDSFSAERMALPLHEMKDPAVVHFTGPVAPSIELVLNPYVQPYTAKPWGYAGSPGHPFREEWWAAVEGTPWRGWRDSLEHRNLMKKQETEVLEASANALRAAVAKSNVN